MSCHLLSLVLPALLLVAYHQVNAGCEPAAPSSESSEFYYVEYIDEQTELDNCNYDKTETRDFVAATTSSVIDKPVSFIMRLLRSFKISFAK
ncbi:hypothetical protein ACLKA6_009404 [Drosophila palustris]